MVSTVCSTIVGKAKQKKERQSLNIKKYYKKIVGFVRLFLTYSVATWMHFHQCLAILKGKYHEKSKIFCLRRINKNT